MRDDLRRALQSVAREPRTTPDVERDWNRARRRTVASRVGAAAVAATVAAVGVPAVLDHLDAPPVPVVTSVVAGGTQTPDRSDGDGSAGLGAVRRWRINGYGVELLVPASWSLRNGEPTTWQGDGGSLAVFAGVTPYSVDGPSDVHERCREETSGRPGFDEGRPPHHLEVDGQPGCLVWSVSKDAFVAVVAFPRAPNSSASSALVLVGEGLDGRALVEGLTFDPALEDPADAGLTD